GELEVQGIVAQNIVTGIAAVDSAYVDASGATASLNSSVGIVANVGATVEAPNCVATSNGTAPNGAAIESGNEGVVSATGCQLLGNVIAVFATNESTVSADRAAFVGNTTNFSMSNNSSARRDSAAGDPTLRNIVDGTSTLFP